MVHWILFIGQKCSFFVPFCLLLSPSDPCPTDLDRILTEGQDPGAQQYLVLGTVPIKGKKPGVLGAHAFFVLSTVPIKKKRLQVKPKANKLYKEALEQCNHNNHVSKFI